MIVYYSGTGNSRYCAKMLASKLCDECVDATSYIKNGTAAELCSDKPWIFVSPVYAWQLPHIFADFIRSAYFSGNCNAYFVLTCGSDIGNAAKFIEPLCAEKAFTFRGALQVVMPENYIAMFPVPNEEKSAKIIAAAHPVLEMGAECIAESRPFPKRSFALFDKTKSTLVNDVFYRHFIKASPFYATDRCIGCGKCQTLCPLNNIMLKDSRPVWGNNCTHCMACICYCPTEAIEYGRKSIGKRRYRCPEFEENKP